MSQPPEESAPSYGTPPTYGTPPYGETGYGGEPAPYGGAELAGWWRRVGASFLDGLIFCALVLVAAGVLGGIVGVASGGDAASGVPVAIGFLLGLSFWIWNYIIRQGKTGQTLGKSALGISVRREADGSSPGYGGALLRAVLHYFVDGILLLGYLWPLWDKKKQTWTDKIQGTVVIKV